jgi:hypothetical protein
MQSVSVNVVVWQVAVSPLVVRRAVVGWIAVGPIAVRSLITVTLYHLRQFLAVLGHSFVKGAGRACQDVAFGQVVS